MNEAQNIQMFARSDFFFFSVSTCYLQRVKDHLSYLRNGMWCRKGDKYVINYPNNEHHLMFEKQKCEEKKIVLAPLARVRSLFLNS